uniref:Uncharacterized protein n=1 Tax=Mus spicilegus TaxID=10103 RepID=A0A8C6MWR6_MUSSI
ILNNHCANSSLAANTLTHLFIYLFIYFVFETGFLCSSGCPGTHFVDQAGLELRNPPASASQVLGLKACLVVLIEVCKLDHQVRGHDGQRQVNLDFCLSGRQLNFLGFVPASWPRRDNKS